MKVRAMLGQNVLAGWVAIFGLCATGAGCAQFSGPALGVSPQQNQVQTLTNDPTILAPTLRDPRILPGDLMLVHIFGTTDFPSPVRVSVDGTIQLPLIGSVTIAGLTINQTENLIAERLKNAGMYLDPQVTVQVTESVSQFATVAGELHAVVPLAGNRRLLDVIAAAGSLPPTASHVITILREGQEKPIIVDLGTDPAQSAKADIQILPGDKILISRVGVVYILGAFKTQGAIPLQQNSPLTLMQATALSGGVGYEGKYNDLRLVRTTGLERSVVTVNIKRVLNGQDPDPVLQADDIVFLPSSALKAAIKGGGLNTITSLASVLLIAYEQQQSGK